jgi:heat-inducible transcriptional repressor
MLSPRQETVLRLVVERHLDGGAPVGSRVLAEHLSWGPSTIRSELAGLEDLGFLDHPHTSAGRVPTEAGYRFVVDSLLRDRRGSRPKLSIGLDRRELDEALREATEQLAGVTELLAIVTAPAITKSTIRHVELLEPQPGLLMVVIITSSGAVTKRAFSVDGPVDPGLLVWASSFLNERLVGMGPGAKMLRGRLMDDSLDPREVAMLELLASAFTGLEREAEEALFVDGATRMVEHHRLAEEHELGSVVSMLEKRVELLSALRSAVDQPDVVVRIGQENESPAMRSMAMVAAGYGPARGSVGTVSVLGPVRMDYELAIGAVRQASAQLSKFVEDVYTVD